MKLFAKYIQAILDGEVNVHNGYMADFGITQEELDHTPITVSTGMAAISEQLP